MAFPNSLVDLFEKAMETEYTYGSQNGLIPVVDYVLDSLNKVKCTTKFNPSCHNIVYFMDIYNCTAIIIIVYNMQLSGLLTEEAISKRILIYSLLSAEGSHRSQQVHKIIIVKNKYC